MPRFAWDNKIWLALAFLLSACASAPVTVPVPQTVLVPATVLVTVRVPQPVTVEVEVTRLAQVIVTATPTPTPSATPTALNTPTRTLVPSPTLIPTTTPRPTSTPTFTPSPFPTVTPSDTPDPFFFSHRGNLLLPILKPTLDGPALLHIIGNSAQTFFTVKNFDVDNNALAILVNITTAYSGTVPIDLLPDDRTQHLEINASGPWTIRVLPLSAARTLTATPLTGFGDDVILLTGDVRAVKISGNAAGQYFGVFAYYARTRDLIVNTTTPYAETLTLPEGTTVLEVKAVGEWKIELK